MGTSTIGLKIMMAVSGLFFVFYVLVHMYGNLKILAGHQGFDDYAHHLRVLGEPILPYTGMLWIFRILLIVAVIAHAYSAFKLWGRAGSARSQKYAAKSTVKASFSSKTMRWGGVALLLFVIFHILHFTLRAVPMPAYTGSPAAMVVAGFQNPLILIIYTLAMIALAMHLHHGVWSACQTLGLTNTAKSRGLAKAAGMIVAVVVAVGFLIPPFAIALRFIQ